jgi:hypothetical protein
MEWNIMPYIRFLVIHRLHASDFRIRGMGSIDVSYSVFESFEPEYGESFVVCKVGAPFFSC